MFLTHTFPLVIGITYVIVRSIYEPPALRLLFKLPYQYYTTGGGADTSTATAAATDYVNSNLKDTQLDCWMTSSAHDQVEAICDKPNAVLVLVSCFGVLTSKVLRKRVGQQR